jgi:hypothetical protein
MKTAAVLAGLTAVLWAQSTQVKPFQPKAPPEQPIPFSHKTHAGTAGVKCMDCHTIRPPGDAAGIPRENVCMGCHASIKKESAAIHKLAEYSGQKKPVPWVRVYRLPRTIYFSHEIHAKKARIDCAECHGLVAEREALAQEKSIAMADCMACHDRYKASNDCNLCHDSH